MMLKEKDRIRTPVETEGFPIGTMNVIESVYSPESACQVELWNPDNYPVDAVVCKLCELEAIEQ